jgi:murein DD-endopeptidase MepM/ murein hydrolase activator NlpD
MAAAGTALVEPALLVSAAGEPIHVLGGIALQEAQQTESLAHILAKEIVVKRGDTLLDLLVREGVARDQAHEVVGALKPVFDPRRLRHKQSVTMTYEAPDENSFEFKSLNIKLDPEHEVRVARCEDNSFTANEIINEFETRTQRAEFAIDSSLYVAADQNGVPFDMLLPIINVFAYDVDFQRDIRSGDYFEIMYETKVDDAGDVVCSGTTSYAALTTQGRRLTLYHYQDSDGTVDYFDAEGRSLKKNLMITPVDGARISSGYGRRRHPILGYSRMHRGLDFAAPSGTPIKAAGDGVVELASYSKSYGKNIRLRHGGQYKTRYAHMRRFARGMRPGVRVKQGQIIGYVGSTGMSTGPHLHYEVYYQGRSINPRSIKTKPNRILKGAELERFTAARDALETRFASLKDPAVFAQIASPEA